MKAPSPTPPGLRYALDSAPGIRRRRAGKGFTYVGPDGRAVRDAETLDRIRTLAIPPAWERVWICPDPRGHVQATGRDARGRKQYRYHALWTRHRTREGHDRLRDFARALPRLRRRVTRDLRRPGLPREKVLALVVALLERTLIRIGNDEYARDNKSHGLTTLRDRHVRVTGRTVRFEFPGKSGVRWRAEVQDARLARLVRRCQDLPGQELFQYEGDDGALHGVDSSDVNAYLREATGSDFTAKVFRTWAGTCHAARLLAPLPPPRTEAAQRRRIAATMREVAAILGNRPATCREHYVHAAVLDAWRDGRIARLVARPPRRTPEALVQAVLDAARSPRRRQAA